MGSLHPVVKLADYVFEDREHIGTPDGNGLPVLGVTNVSGITSTGKEASGELSKYLRLRPHRFAYNPYRVNVGSIGFSAEGLEGIVSPAYVVFGTRKQLNPQYLFCFLKSREGNRQINYHGGRGSVRAALRFEDLCKLEIPLPSLEEQQRIAARIEQIAAKIEEAHHLRQLAIEEVDSFLNATMSICFDFADALTSVADYARVQGGYAFPSGSYDDFGTHQVLRIGNVRDGFLDLSRAPVRWNPRGDARILRYELQPNDIVISMTGTRDKRDYGFVAKVPVGVKLLLNQRVGRFVIDREIDPDYLYYFLRSPFFRDRLFPSATGTANQANVGNGDIERVSFNPPENLSDQRSVIAKLEALQAKVKELNSLQNKTASELDTLLPSILDRAFKGEV